MPPSVKEVDAVIKWIVKFTEISPQVSFLHLRAHNFLWDMQVISPWLWLTLRDYMPGHFFENLTMSLGEIWKVAFTVFATLILLASLNALHRISGEIASQISICSKLVFFC